MKIRWPVLLVVVAAGIVLGFAQELVKVNINYYLDMSAGFPNLFEKTATERLQLIESTRMDVPYDYYYNHTFINALNYFSFEQLKWAKWIVTVVFILVFYFINRLLLVFLHAPKSSIVYLMWGYAAMFAFALLIYVSGVVLDQHELTYALSRRIVGALQSMIPAMIIFPASLLYPAFKKENVQTTK